MGVKEQSCLGQADAEAKAEARHADIRWKEQSQELQMKTEALRQQEIRMVVDVSFIHIRFHVQ